MTDSNKEPEHVKGTDGDRGNAADALGETPQELVDRGRSYWGFKMERIASSLTQRPARFCTHSSRLHAKTVSSSALARLPDANNLMPIASCGAELAEAITLLRGLVQHMVHMVHVQAKYARFDDARGAE